LKLNGAVQSPIQKEQVAISQIVQANKNHNDNAKFWNNQPVTISQIVQYANHTNHIDNAKFWNNQPGAVRIS
jgi:hypothetical protein